MPPLETTPTHGQKVQGHAKRGPHGGQLIFSKPLQDIINTTLDIATDATPRRFRLVDCHCLMNENELRIYEFEQIPTVPYVAISYVWRGNLPSSDWEEEIGTFSVKGAEDGDPISIDVLKSVSKAVSIGLQFSVGPFLWLDRLCILQTDKSDKAWQISHMYEIYKSCMVCVVLPGGIGRLVKLDEETDWIHRGWTLQEALAPDKVVVLFHFSRDFFDADEAVDNLLKECENCDNQDFAPSPREVYSHSFLREMKRSGRTAWIPLDKLLDFAIKKLARLEKKRSPPEGMPDNPSILGGYKECQLLKVARTASISSYTGRQEWREQAVWRLSFIRTSSRPVDMVFSIMQLFDVNLDVTKFDKDDRLGATIALASEILRRGKTASWLPALYTLDFNPQICTFPPFPMTSVAGKALVKKADGEEVEMIKELQRIPDYCWVDDTPGGSMDKDGYLTFTSAAARIVQVPNTEAPGVKRNSGPKEVNGFMHIAAEDESIWRIHPEASDTQKLDKKPRAFMVLLGVQRANIMVDSDQPEPEGSPIVLIIEEHAPERFHKISSFLFWVTLERYQIRVKDREFRLGGPEPVQGGDRPWFRHMGSVGCP